MLVKKNNSLNNKSMGNKLVKEVKDIPADFNIESYWGGSSKEGESSKAVHSIQPTELTEPNENPMPIPAKKTVSTKERKNSFVEYQETFLRVPKITDRKNVFISNSTRKLIVGIVRRFGGEKTSVSGFLENLALHHLGEYGEDLEAWKKL
ncbi:hypothetical protein FACS189411_08380 [Bacteroidia bacterium]|nr:hypothetical protein FACS189411_08380 [Bacteroidia bacterium]